MSRPSPQQVARRLRRALEGHGKPSVLADWFISWALSKVDEKGLMWAAESNVDPVALFWNHYHLGHPLVSPLAKLLLQYSWGMVQPYITDANRVMEVLRRKPENAAVLDTPQARQYL